MDLRPTRGVESEASTSAPLKSAVVFHVSKQRRIVVGELRGWRTGPVGVSQVFAASSFPIRGVPLVGISIR